MTAWQGGEMARGRLPPPKRKKEVCPTTARIGFGYPCRCSVLCVLSGKNQIPHNTLSAGTKRPYSLPPANGFPQICVSPCTVLP